MLGMRKATLFAVGFAVLASSSAASEFPTKRDPVEANVSVCFVPGEDCESEIASAIGDAETDIHLQAYDFTSTKILGALRAAVARGVKVDAILDRQDVRHFAAAGYLSLAGAGVWIDDQVAIAHNKLIMIDGWEVIGGSFNFTKAAQHRNAENVTFMNSPEVAAWFMANWESRRAASRPYAGVGK